MVLRLYQAVEMSAATQINGSSYEGQNSRLSEKLDDRLRTPTKAVYRAKSGEIREDAECKSPPPLPKGHTFCKGSPR